jgi:cobalt-zinc-cadmium efflux system protein
VAFGRAFAVGIALNLAYVIAEAAYGVLANSLALLSDAGHNLGDVLSLGLAWMAASMARRAPSARYTYGLRGSSILAALSNAVLLLVITGGVAWAAILRLIHPEPSAGATVMAVAGAGVVVNGLTAWMFAAGRKGDVNIRAAFAHMASDALVAAGVVAAGAAIYFTHWMWLDPAVSLAIGVVIVTGTWSLLRESLDLALQAVPVGVDRGAVRDYLASLPGVAEVHDLHIWGMSTTETALTAHLVRPGADVDDLLIHNACAELRSRFQVHHCTLQVENGAMEHPCHLADETVV